MTNETNETIIDSTNNEQEVELELTEETAETTEVQEEVKPVEKPVETPEARLARLKRMVDQQEKKLGVKKEAPVAKPVDSKVSTQDLVALMKAEVAEEDISEVEEYASFKKISIAEALRTSVVKSLLAEKQEKRNTANATNTGSARRSPAKISDEEILAKARKGDEVDTDKLVEARWNEKKAQGRK